MERRPVRVCTEQQHHPLLGGVVRSLRPRCSHDHTRVTKGPSSLYLCVCVCVSLSLSCLRFSASLSINSSPVSIAFHYDQHFSASHLSLRSPSPFNSLSCSVFCLVQSFLPLFLSPHPLLTSPLLSQRAVGKFNELYDFIERHIAYRTPQVRLSLMSLSFSRSLSLCLDLSLSLYSFSRCLSRFSSLSSLPLTLCLNIRISSFFFIYPCLFLTFVSSSYAIDFSPLHWLLLFGS